MCRLLTSLLVLFFVSLSNSLFAQVEPPVSDDLNKSLGTEHPDYANSLNNLASYNASLGDYTEAISLCTEALNIYEKVYGTEHPSCATSLNNLATYNYYLGNYPGAIRFGTKALNICGKALGTEHPDYAAFLSNLATYYFLNREIGPTSHYSLLCSEAVSALVKRNFAELTSGQRQQFWEKHKYWYEEYVHCFSYTLPLDTLTLNGYNAVLLSKGLLLNSEIEFSRLIQESGDSTVMAMYNDLRMLRLQINKLLEKPISERFANVDSLERIAQAKEQALVDSSKVYGDYTANLVITWEQVRDKLGDKDAAVEFVSFPLNADSTMYIAYVLRSDYECPRMIPLFEESQLKDVPREQRYTTDAVSRLLWAPLDEALQGAERIYFAPSGELYNIAIKSIPTHEDGGQTLIGDHGREYYRLSSTRELALIKERSRWSDAAVYRGLRYDMSVAAMTRDDDKYTREGSKTRGGSTPGYLIYRGDSTEWRTDRGALQGLDYLDGTLEEAKAISRDLEAKTVTTQLLTDTLGTEASFKALDGKKTSIVHIGTHGFFNNKQREYKDDRAQLLSTDRQPTVTEDDALTRSGLCFAGADNVWMYGPSAVPDSIDDGILRASEIARLDLRGLDLVVLSACQTGLGEITGDGVFGLQRGFKKAGAQTIVMSLWEVDDDATTAFMTRFFEHIALDEHGLPLNKHEAFTAAREYLREHKAEFHDPDSYAAFIMLDGVDR